MSTELSPVQQAVIAYGKLETAQKVVADAAYKEAQAAIRAWEWAKHCGKAPVTVAELEQEFISKRDAYVKAVLG